MDYKYLFHSSPAMETTTATTTCNSCTCCPRNSRTQVKYNSAFRLCYSLQLLPCYNEKHQLITISPRPHTPQCKMRNSSNQHHTNNRTNHNHNYYNNNSNDNNHNDRNSNSNNGVGDQSHCNNSSSDPTTGTGTGRLVGGGGAAGPADVGSLKVEPGTTHSIMWLPLVVVTALLGLYLVYSTFMEAVGNSHQVKFPSSIQDIQDMTDFLLSAKENHPAHLLLLFSTAYVFKQSFAVPGSVFLNLLAGALFGPYLGFVLTCTLTAIGATCCFLLSRTFGMVHVIRYFPNRVRFFQEKVESNKNSLFFFLLFLRLFPMTPNWAINMICPIVGVPIHLFFLSVFIGLMPYNFICVQTGDVLSQISSVNDVLDVWTMAKMACVALVALMPGLAIKWFKIKQE